MKKMKGLFGFGAGVRKGLAAAAVLLWGLTAGPLSLQAAETPPQPDEPARSRSAAPACYRDLNGRGEIIPWVRSEAQCRRQSNGQSWGYPGRAVNIYRDVYLD